jgi:hypothetical protein
MHSRTGFYKLTILVSFTVLLVSCGMQGVSMNKGENWLTSKTDKPEMDVSGTWYSPEWGEAILKQEENRITGTIGDYPVKGVISGKGLYLMMYSGEIVHYFAELKEVDKDMFTGLYSKYHIIDEVRNDSAFTRPMKLTKGASQ